MILNDVLPISTLCAGDSIRFTILSSSINIQELQNDPQYGYPYPASSNYHLLYALKLPGSPAVTFQSSTNPNNVDFDINVASTVTQAWLPGTYNVQVFVVSTVPGERYKIVDGNFVIEADLSASAPAFDGRTQNKITYDAICAVMNGQMDGIQEIMISGRSIKKMPFGDLQKARAYFHRLVEKENGINPMKVVKFQFGRYS